MAIDYQMEWLSVLYKDIGTISRNWLNLCIFRSRIDIQPIYVAQPPENTGKTKSPAM